VSPATASIADLPHALREEDRFAERLGGRSPAVFTDYDGVLTPIVERPEDAVISDSMREVLRDLARRCPVCVVSGRDRPVVQELMGIDDLVVAGSHGFDIWSPEDGTLEHEAGTAQEGLIEQVTEQLREAVGGVEGVAIEPKKISVAAQYRLVADDGDRARVRDAVERLLAERPNELKMTPGKMVYELQPKIDWDKGRAVLYLIDALGLDREDVIPLYFGDDITDEHAFEALTRLGVGIFVGSHDDPELGGRSTAADFVLDSVAEVERFLDGLAR
jgi:trehalose 6-phosphate phosphatase